MGEVTGQNASTASPDITGGGEIVACAEAHEVGGFDVLDPDGCSVESGMARRAQDPTGALLGPGAPDKRACESRTVRDGLEQGRVEAGAAR